MLRHLWRHKVACRFPLNEQSPYLGAAHIEESGVHQFHVVWQTVGIDVSPLSRIYCNLIVSQYLFTAIPSVETFPIVGTYYQHELPVGLVMAYGIEGM